MEQNKAILWKKVQLERGGEDLSKLFGRCPKLVIDSFAFRCHRSPILSSTLAEYFRPTDYYNCYNDDIVI
jgi:hypothetical protein